VLLSGAAIVEAVNVTQKKFESILRERPASVVPGGKIETADSGQDIMTAPYFPAPHQFPEVVPQDLPSSTEFSDEYSDQIDEKSASDIFDQARRLAQSGSREKAIELLRELVRRFPKTAEAEKARKTLEKSGISSRN
jgi:tetratricopeptide (TPR) repeat protein